jgi:hypothetical protein
MVPNHHATVDLSSHPIAVILSDRWNRNAQRMNSAAPMPDCCGLCATNRTGCPIPAPTNYLGVRRPKTAYLTRAQNFRPDGQSARAMIPELRQRNHYGDRLTRLADPDLNFGYQQRC